MNRDYRLKFLYCAQCALLVERNNEKYCPVLTSVVVLVNDAFMILILNCSL